MTRSLIAVLLFLVKSQADIISRLQHIKYDPETSKEIAVEEKKLRILLEKELGNTTNSWEPLHLQDRAFYLRRGTAMLSELALTVGGAHAVFRPDLRRKVIDVALSAEGIAVEGLFSVALSNHKVSQGVFRCVVERAHCGGTAALDNGGLEWLLLECPRHTFPATQIMAETDFPGSAELSDDINEDVDHEVEEALRTLLASSLRSLLAKSKLSDGKLAQNQAYQSMAETEKLDSNTLLDAAIELIAFVLQRKFNDSVPIPDIEEGISFSLLMLSLDTGFMARRGSARGVSGLKRMGNAHIVRRNDTLHFAGALAVPWLLVEYRDYRAAVLGLGPVGHLDVTVTPVNVGLRVRLDFDKRKIFLDSFKITTLGKTVLKVSGMGRLAGRILTDLTNSFHGLVRKVIAKVVEERITSQTRATLEKNTLDQILQGEMQY